MPNSLFKTTKILGFFIGVIAISLSLSYLVSAWTEPSVNPPNNNVSTPPNIGSTGQSKSGGLILNTGGAPNGLIVQNGNVGIGTTNPGAKLDVSGNIKIADGTQGAGKVLTSDANGVASWQTASNLGAGNSVMNLRSLGWDTGFPASCPAGWSEADYKEDYVESGGANKVLVRTCYRIDRACQVMYLRGYPWDMGPPASCPAGWSEADYKREYNGTGYDRLMVRTCYRCS